MAPTTNLFRAAKPAFRQTLYFSSASPARSAFQSNTMRFRTQFREAFKRWQSTTASAEAPTASFASRMWNSPVGLKTVHFWAPVMKVRWSLPLWWFLAFWVLC